MCPPCPWQRNINVDQVSHLELCLLSLCLLLLVLQLLDGLALHHLHLAQLLT